MLTNEDIVNIVQAVTKAEKELFYSKTELDEKFQKMEKSFASLQTSVDGLAVTFKNYYEELNHICFYTACIKLLCAKFYNRYCNG